jgi:hypothetical protein
MGPVLSGITARILLDENSIRTQLGVVALVDAES